MSLADHVDKAIKSRGNGSDSFFIMVEGGKIDWAGHANDIGANIHDVIALDDAVKVAKNFYDSHPADTLIIVTADHETGGMAVSSSASLATAVDRQKVSHMYFNTEYFYPYKASRPINIRGFSADINTLFGSNNSGTGHTEIIKALND